MNNPTFFDVHKAIISANSAAVLLGSIQWSVVFNLDSNVDESNKTLVFIYDVVTPKVFVYIDGWNDTSHEFGPEDDMAHASAYLHDLMKDWDGDIIVDIDIKNTGL